MNIERIKVEKMKDSEWWESVQDDIANNRTNDRNARGEVYPNNRAGRRAQAKQNKVDRKQRQKRTQWQ